MIRRFSAALFLLVALPALAAIQHDFGQGLHYVRITDLTKDSTELQTALTENTVIIDLRNVTSSPEAAAAFATKLDQPPPGTHGVRMILINPSSAAFVTEALARPHPREITIGPKTPALQPDIAVPTTVEDDRQAYDALNNGVAIDKLLSSNPDKKRFDEAALARGRANAAAEGEGDHDDEPDAPPTKVEKPAEPTSPAVPHDLVLGRAVQLHRALVAAKR